MKKLAGVLGVMLLLSACGSSKYEAQIDHIDSLNTVLGNVEERINLYDSAQVAQIYDDYFKLWDEFNTTCNDAQIEEHFNTLVLYGYIKKPLKNYLKKIHSLKTELRLTRDQLSRLKSDLEHNSYNDSLVRVYIDTEEISVNMLSEVVDFHNENVRTELHRYDSLTPIITEVIASIKK